VKVFLVSLAAVCVLATAASAVEVVAAGDIATRRRGDARTSDLILALDPHRVLTLGDNAYDRGTFSQFDRLYDPTWGRFKNRTWPAPGNHDWETAGAAGYERYFDVRAGRLHRHVAGAWLVISLDSEVRLVRQRNRLRRVLRSDTHRCELLYWHTPRYSSGEHGNSAKVERWWKVAAAHHVELVLNGHDHDYERFAPKRGIRQIVVGTGGAPTKAFDRVKAGSVKRLTGDSNWGVLALTLKRGSYSGRFRRATGGRGTVADSFSGTC
jgi:acid phosphatase type 7